MRRLWPYAFLLAIGTPEHAFAHSTMAGSDGFYAGVLHPLVVPAHLMALVATGLWIGQHDSERIGNPLLAFAVLFTIGSAVGLFHPWDDASLLLLLLALIIGLLVAAERSLPFYLAMPLAGLVAWSVGIDSAPDGAGTLTVRLIALLGTFIGAHLLVLNLVALVSSNMKAWADIAFRIAGSWIAASAILVLAFEFKP